MKSPWVLAIVLALLLVVLSLLRALVNWIKGPAKLPYRCCDSLLSPAEHSFYDALRMALGNADLMIFAKVRLGDLLLVPRGTPEGQGHRNRVQSKHVDFVLCDRQHLRPVLVIELDDRSHQRQDRRDRDAFVDRAFEAAGLPILHVPCKRSYVPKELAQAIWPMLQPQAVRR